MLLLKINTVPVYEILKRSRTSGKKTNGFNLSYHISGDIGMNYPNED